MSELKSVLESEKIQQIRDAALEAFLLFGFKRTSMEEIAVKAGMSRAALYLYFRNKQEIYQSVVAGLVDQMAIRFEAALDPEAPVAATVVSALEAKDGGLMQRVLASPHGPEMMAVREAYAAGEMAEGAARITALLVAYFKAVLADRQCAGETDPDVLAEFIIQTHISFYNRADDGHRMGLLGRTAAALLGTD